MPSERRALLVLKKHKVSASCITQMSSSETNMINFRENILNVHLIWQITHVVSCYFPHMLFPCTAPVNVYHKITNTQPHLFTISGDDKGIKLAIVYQSELELQLEIAYQFDTATNFTDLVLTRSVRLTSHCVTKWLSSHWLSFNLIDSRRTSKTIRREVILWKKWIFIMQLKD
jgi:hypothetical protein